MQIKLERLNVLSYVKPIEAESGSLVYLQTGAIARKGEERRLVRVEKEMSSRAMFFAIDNQNRRLRFSLDLRAGRGEKEGAV